MSSQRTRHQPALEALETRLALSSTIPANTIAVTQGTVPAPGAVAEVSVPISAHNINGRIPILIGTATTPTPKESGLLPKVIAAFGPDGKKLPVRQGAPFKLGKHSEATAFVQDGTPGPLTIRVTGAHQTAGSFQLRAYLPGDINGDGQVTLADLRAIGITYRTVQGDALYNQTADANLNGQIGQTDARAIVRNLKPLTPKIPLEINLFLKPSEDIKHNVPSTSGGHTYYQTPTIMGHTTPGSVVFADSGLGDYTFSGPALATDAQGNFSVVVKNVDGLNNFEFLVVDPYGQQKIQDYPIYYFPAVYTRHPRPHEAKVGVPGTTPIGPGSTLVASPPGTVLPGGTP